MIPREMRRTRTVLRALPFVLLTMLISGLLYHWIAAPLGDPWSFVVSIVLGLATGNMIGYLTADWVLAPLFERPALKGVYAYPELNPNVDLDQLLRTFSELSIDGPVCRDCGMDDQDLNRELRCPPCTALHDQREAQR
jgi:hypothetical protein